MISVVLFLIGLLGMEAGAYVQHRYLWHQGPRVLHRMDGAHHKPKEPLGSDNDLLALSNAAVCMASCLVSRYANWMRVFAVCCGVTGYGLLYLLFHDGFVHGRFGLKAWAPTWSPAFRRLAAAHAEILAARENGTTGPAAHSAVVGVGV